MAYGWIGCDGIGQDERKEDEMGWHGTKWRGMVWCDLGWVGLGWSGVEWVKIGCNIVQLGQPHSPPLSPLFVLSSTHHVRCRRMELLLRQAPVLNHPSCYGTQYGQANQFKIYCSIHHIHIKESAYRGIINTTMQHFSQRGNSVLECK